MIKIKKPFVVYNLLRSMRRKTQSRSLPINLNPHLSWKRPSYKRQLNASVISLAIVALVVGILLPIATVRAEQTLTWTSNADFAFNKTSNCQSTEVSNLAISADTYTDVTCATEAVDSDLSLSRDKFKLTSMQGISAGDNHSLALKEDGTVWAWGSNNEGQLGDETIIDRPIPVQVKDASGAGFLTDVSAISAGGSHSLALKEDGTVWAWGKNSDYQLGINASLPHSTIPVQVKDASGAGFLTDVSAISTGATYSLALKDDGTVWGWGDGSFGRIGDGSLSSSDRRLPVQVKDTAGTGYLTGITAISSGGSHSLALKEDGTVWAWGFNGNGQLGDDTITQRYAPVQVKDTAGTGYLTGITAISPGTNHSLALKDDGTVWAWGHNGFGQLGDSTTDQHNTPTRVKDTLGLGFLSGITSITTKSSHSLALKEDGTVWAWGQNQLGQLGDNSTIVRSTPYQVKGTAGAGFLSDVVDISAGGSHSLALKEDGTVWAWGRNTSGQSGYERYAGSILTPNAVVSRIDVETLTGVISTVTGNYHSLALKEDGTVWAWGSNQLGQLGDNTTTQRNTPVQVKDAAGTGYLTDIVAITAGDYHSLALKEDGTVWAWGRNDSGRLGDNTTTQRSTPVQVKDAAGTGYLTGVSEIYAGFYHSLALKEDGTVWAWGQNNSGQLGDGSSTDRSTPVQVKDAAGTGYLTSITAIAAGGSHSLALKDDGTVWAWGTNGSGQLGDNTITQRRTPAQVKDTAGTGYLTSITAIAADGSHSLALKDDGTAWAWGTNGSGQLGDNTITQRNTPTQVKDTAGTGYLTSITAISAGNQHSLALKDDGTVWAWGEGSNGRLGDGSSTDRRTPVQVKDTAGTGYLTSITAISAGNQHSLALKDDGTVWAWGHGSNGQLGNMMYSVELGTLNDTPLGVTWANFSTGYALSGNLLNIVIDVGDGKKTKWYGVNWQSEALPDSTSIEFAARTSNDGTTWSDWSSAYMQIAAGSVSGSGDLSSLPFSRYLEIKATLSSLDQVASPTLNDFSLSFMDDDTPPPTNTTAIVMSENQGGDNVEEDEWTNDPTPYFSWQAGADEGNGSGIQGYCLYLGHDNTADVTQAKGLFGTSPIDTDGACQYTISTNHIDMGVDDILATPLTTSDDSYYLLVKAIDNAGNLYDGTAASFAFRYDDTPPANPAFISAPSQFIATKDATLTWPTTGSQAAADANSGLAGLQYKIGPNGIWYGDGHTGAQDISDVLENDGSYQTDPTIDYPLLVEGNNTIYFRAIDSAGNVSTSNNSAAIKLNTSSPTPPQNVSASPSTSATNSFAFSWQKPSSFVGPANSLTYCYTINTLPSANTCTYTNPGQTSLPADAFATQPGENIFYVVAKDEAGNINYDTYTSVKFNANTPAPGMPMNTEIADISTKVTQSWKLAVSWAAPEDVGAGVSKYGIYRSTDNVVYTQVATTSGLSYVDSSLDQRTYYYKIKACDSANNCGAFSEVFSELPTGRFINPPELVSSPSVEVSTKKASFYWVTDRTSDSRIQYGTESGVYFPGEIAVSEQLKLHTVEILNLEAGTTYYYKAKWTDEDGNTGSTSELSFTTLPAPSVKNVEVIKKTLNSATIQFTSTDATMVNMYYGKTEGFGGLKSVNTSRSESTYTVELTGLDDGSLYSYKISTFDSDGNEYDSRRIDTFTTPPRPRISDLKFQPVAGEPTSTQKVSWVTNVPTSSTVTYGKTGTNGTDTFASKMTTSHEVTLRGLEDDSQYFLLAQSRDADGNLAVSDRQSFKTALDTRPPKVTDIRIEPSVKGNGSEARGQIIVSWKTDEPATSQVAYADGSGSEYTNRTAEDTRMSTEHVVIISDLGVSKVYHLQPISRDKAQNTSHGDDKSAIIGRASDSVLNIILNSLYRIFGI